MVWAAAFAACWAEGKTVPECLYLARKAIQQARDWCPAEQTKDHRGRSDESVAMLREMLGEGEEVCPGCDGQGVTPGPPDGNWYDCPTCHGTGQPGEKRTLECPRCGGTSWGGGTDAGPRPWCNGCGEPQPGWTGQPGCESTYDVAMRRSAEIKAGKG
jgi:hypothetical protein